jgi:hypothetical protein
VAGQLLLPSVKVLATRIGSCVVGPTNICWGGGGGGGEEWGVVVVVNYTESK